MMFIRCRKRLWRADATRVKVAGYWVTVRWVKTPDANKRRATVARILMASVTTGGKTDGEETG